MSDFESILALSLELLTKEPFTEPHRKLRVQLQELLPDHWWAGDNPALYAKLQRRLPKPRQRLRDAIENFGDHGRIEYRQLARAVYPDVLFPKAWNHSANGGPPGCFMPLSAMIRRMEDVDVRFREHGQRFVYRRTT